MASSSFLSEKDKLEIAAAIKEAELNTIGEVRVYVEKKCKVDVMDRALKVFHQLKMDQTKEHSGVLIYVAYVDHLFAIMGDKGIHEKVPPTFWDDVKENMRLRFSSGHFMQGIKEAILLCGNHLKKHFPAHGSNPNELSNEVVIRDE